MTIPRTKAGDYVVGKVTLYAVSTCNHKARHSIAEWLRDVADTVDERGTEFAFQFTARRLEPADRRRRVRVGMKGVGR